MIVDLGALFLRQAFRFWAAVGVCAWVLQWMPKPFEMRSLPSPDIFLSGFAIQLPLFALATLAALKPSGWRASLTLLTAFGAWVSFVVLSELHELMLPTILAVIAGAVLMTYSYSCWLNVEVD